MVKRKGQIGLSAGNLQEVEFLVDTGSFYTILPPEIAESLGIEFPESTKVVLADSREATVNVGVAYWKLDGREGGVIVGVIKVPMPLLGASALEVLGLKVDPVAEKLEPTRPFEPAAL
jgi:clan AA aspartic protease